MGGHCVYYTGGVWLGVLLRFRGAEHTPLNVTLYLGLYVELFGTGRAVVCYDGGVDREREVVGVV